MRPKWGERRGADTYGGQTIAAAFARTYRVYEPRGRRRGRPETGAAEPAVVAGQLLEQIRQAAEGDPTAVLRNAAVVAAAARLKEADRGSYEWLLGAAKGEIAGFPKTAFNKAISDVAKALKREARAAEPRPDDGRVGIEVVPGAQNEIRAEALAAFSGHPDLFVRGNMLTQVVTDELAAKIMPLAHADVLGPYLADVAYLCKTEVRDGVEKLVRLDPPAWLKKAIFHDQRFENFRQLYGIVGSPRLRPDGALATEPGYDPLTKYVYRPVGEPVVVPDRPTFEEAVAAYGRLADLVGDFPFAPIDGDGGAANRAAWVALLLTGLARPAVDGPVPLFVVSGNRAGTGKTTLVDLVSVLDTGGVAPHGSFPTKPDEMEKTVLAVALAGYPTYLFDNAPQGLDVSGSSLDNILTSQKYSGRVLGLSKVVVLPFRTVLALTGNNIQPAGDTVRRTVTCRLVTHLDRPHQRDDFKIQGDIVRHVKENRAAYLRDALVILREAAAAGWPAPPERLVPTGFDAWDRVVRATVARVAGADPCRQRFLTEERDRDETDLGALLDGWAVIDDE
jgi:putative DNA primase/helicase